ncbi:MAG: metalloregulator ArsR/SmtB family transcription factor [Patescibacteria group bacterium]
MYKRCKCSCQPNCSRFDDKQLAVFEERLKLISVKARLQILLLLSDEPHCVCDIMSHTGQSQSLISHHLADLAEACLVESKKDGRYVEYFLTSKGREVLKAVNMCCEVNPMRGGENNMTEEKHECGCDNSKENSVAEKDCDCGGNCKQETTETKALSKDMLLTNKAKLEAELAEVNAALTNAE